MCLSKIDLMYILDVAITGEYIHKSTNTHIHVHVSIHFVNMI